MSEAQRLADSCSVTKRASRKRCYVALAQNADNVSEKDDSCVIIGDRISETSIRRSGLLSGIENTDGLASLPPLVSPEEFKLWEAAYLVDVELPPDELVAVLKVADALGDSKSATWVQKLAEMASCTDWGDSKKADDMLCSLTHLPPHLLPHVLSGCLEIEYISDLLGSFPSPLHPSLMTAATESGSLLFSPSIAATVLTHLPHTSVPHPGLQSIEIIDSDTSAPVPADYRMPAATGALFARALSTHPSLTSISLTNLPVSPQWMRSFAACLAPTGLPALVNLTFCADADGGGCAAAATCLRLLPALTSLDICFNVPPQPPIAASSLSAYTHLTAAPATLPHLKSLSFTEGNLGELLRFNPWHSAGAVPRHSCIPSFLPLICAPALARCELKTLAATSLLPAVLLPLARYTALKHLHAIITLQPSVAVQPLEALRRNFSSAKELPALSISSCFVESVCPVSVVATAAAVASMARASLNNLCLHSGGLISDDSYAEEGTEDLILQSWRDFFPLVSRCPKLKDLTLNCISGMSADCRPEFSRIFASAVGQMTGLAYIRLCQHENDVNRDDAVLSGQTLGAAIAKLSMLGHFSVMGSGHVFDSMQPVLDACTRLERLTRLVLRCDGILLSQVDALLARQRALKEIEVAEDIVEQWQAAADHDVEALQARYPDVVMIFQ